MIDNETMDLRRSQVFVSYAHADEEIAHQVAEALENAGLRVWIDVWELATGDSIAHRIETAVSSSDILLVLLSPRSVHSRWVERELNARLFQELRDRAITVIPALIEDCEIPPLLADRVFLDLRTDRVNALKRLVDQIGSAPDMDFSRLDSSKFEQLVADLLNKLGFVVQPIQRSRDSGVDLVATFRSRDPFGAEHTDTWLVDTKLYREQRVSVSSLQQMTVLLSTHAGVDKKGLIITNGCLTSVARNFLLEARDRSGHDLRVIDGTELANILIQHPDLIRAYFPRAGTHG